MLRYFPALQGVTPGVATAWLGGVLNGRVDAVFLDVPISELLNRIKSRVECPDCRWSGQRSQLDHDGRCPECGGNFTVDELLTAQQNREEELEQS